MNDSNPQPYQTRICNRQRRLKIIPQNTGALVSLVLSGEGVESGEVSILLVNNAIMKKYNHKLLGRDYSTDVISIPQPRDFPGGNPVPPLGDIIISTEQVISQAPEFGQTPQREFDLCLIHGLLHLLGYEDTPPIQRTKMAKREQYFLAQAARRRLSSCVD